MTNSFAVREVTEKCHKSDMDICKQKLNVGESYSKPQKTMPEWNSNHTGMGTPSLCLYYQKILSHDNKLKQLKMEKRREKIQSQEDKILYTRPLYWATFLLQKI